jgi:adenylate cyclase
MTHQSHARPHSTLAEVLWLLGLPDQALQRCYEALSLVQDHGTPYDVVAELGTTVELRLLAGVQVRVNEDLAQFHELVCRYGYTQFETWDRYLHGWAMIASAGLQGVAQMEIALQDFQATNARARLSRFFGLIAKGYMDCGEIEKAESALAKARKHVEEHSERFWEAELYRLQGEILFQQRGDNDHLAEAWYRRAMEKAKSQQAKMLELRAATSLAKLWLRQGQRKEAHALLLELLGAFTEGWATPDLQNAKRLLAT